jgi:hypothetical protein
MLFKISCIILLSETKSTSSESESWDTDLALDGVAAGWDPGPVETSEPAPLARAPIAGPEILQRRFEDVP